MRTGYRASESLPYRDIVIVQRLAGGRIQLHPGFAVSAQSIDLGGLLCLFDAEGPCGNAVKDAQRSKTTPDTRRTLSLIWGTKALPDRAARTYTWYRELLQQQGATTEPVSV